MLCRHLFGAFLMFAPFWDFFFRVIPKFCPGTPPKGREVDYLKLRCVQMRWPDFVDVIRVNHERLRFHCRQYDDIGASLQHLIVLIPDGKFKVVLNNWISKRTKWKTFSILGKRSYSAEHREHRRRLKVLVTVQYSNKSIPILACVKEFASFSPATQ